MVRFKILVVMCIVSLCILSTNLFAQMTWTQATTAAGWPGRNQHTSVVFDNKMWVFGGTDGNNRLNDVWYSTDGINWTCATATAQWSPRYGHTSVVFDNKMWVMGGSAGGIGGNPFNDVWYSTDGTSWTRACSSAQWSKRWDHTSVIFDNKIWVMGGFDGNSRKNDVWHSTDGVNWTQATASAGWSGRSAHTSVIFDNKIWVMGGFGGTYYNDVWYSTDGVNWTQATANADWTVRVGHTLFVYNNKMWILGGMIEIWNYVNDVWHSADGVNWTRACSSAQWSARFEHTSVVFDNKMWLIGGYAGPGGVYRNDVWYSTGLGVEEIENCKLKNDNFSVYPNPAGSYFTVRLPQTAYCNKIKIFDVSGKMVKSEELNANKRVSLDGIKNGIYFVKVNDDMVQEKLVVTR